MAARASWCFESATTKIGKVASGLDGSVPTLRFESMASGRDGIGGEREGWHRRRAGGLGRRRQAHRGDAAGGDEGDREALALEKTGAGGGGCGLDIFFHEPVCHLWVVWWVGLISTQKPLKSWPEVTFGF